MPTKCSICLTKYLKHRRDMLRLVNISKTRVIMQKLANGNKSVICRYRDT